MTRSGWRGLRRAAFLIVLFLVGAVLFLQTRWAAEGACTLARRNLPRLLDKDVGIQSCQLDPLEQRVTLRGVSLFERSSEESVFAAEEVEVAFWALRPSGGVELQRLRVVHPRVRVDASGPAPVPVRGKKRAECPLEPLRRLRIQHLDIRGGEIQVALSEGRSLELSGVDLSWRTRRGVAELEGAADKGTLHWGKAVDLPVSRLAVEGGFDSDALRLDLSRGELGVDDATLNVVGRVDNLCAPELGLDAQLFVPVRTAAKLGRVSAATSGNVWARVLATGPVAAPKLVADVVTSQVIIDKFAPGDVKARLSLAGDDLKVEELNFAAGPGTVHVEGSVKLSPSLPVKLKLDVHDAEFARVLERASLPGAWVDFLATGKATLSGHLLPQPHLTGNVDLRASKFSVHTRPFDQPELPGVEVLAVPRAHVLSQLKLEPDRFQFTEATVEADHSRVAAEATLFYDPNRGVDIRGTTDALDLTELRQIAGIRWTGKAAGRFSIGGPTAHIQIDSDLSLRDFGFWNFALGQVQTKVQFSEGSLVFPAVSGQKGRTFYSATGTLDFRTPAQGGLHAAAHAFVFGGRTEDLIDMTAALSPSIAFLQGNLAGDADGAVLIDCPVAALDGVVKLNLANTTYYGRHLGDGEAVLRFVQGQSMELERLSLNGPLGTLTAEGTYNFTGPMDYRFRGDRVSVAEAAGASAAARLGLGGSMSLVGTLTGDATTPVADAHLTSSSILAGGKDVGDMQLEGQLQGSKWTVWGRPFGGARVNAQGSLDPPTPYEATLSLALQDLRPLLPAGAVAQGLSGSLVGKATVSGSVSGATPLRASATVDSLTLARGDFQGTVQQPIRLTYDNGGATLRAPITLWGPNTEVVLGRECPSVGACTSAFLGKGALDLPAHGKFDLALLESFTPLLERSAGRMEVAASLGGTPERPTLVGSAEVSDARFGVRGLPMSFRYLSGRADFSEARVLLENVGGYLNDGRMSGSGEVQLDRLRPTEMAIRTHLEDVRLDLVTDLAAHATGELLLHGKPDALALSGRLSLSNVRYTKPWEVQSLVKQLLKPPPLVTLERERKGVALDVQVHAEDAHVDNNIAKARILGDVELVGTTVHPGLLGELRTAEGGQLVFRNTQFSIDSATFTFRDRDAIEPEIDARAQTEVRDEVIRLHAFGRLSTLDYALSASPPLASDDILSLLLNGVTGRDKSNSAGAGLGLAAEGVLAATGFNKVLQDLFPKKILKDVKFDVTTQYNEGSGVVESVARLESKFLTDKLKLRASEPVSGKGTRAQADFRINRNLSLQGQWDNVEPDYNFGNFGGVMMLRGEVQ